MIEMSVTEFSRNLAKVMDRIQYMQEEVAIVRNSVRIACLLPEPCQMTALEAMGDLYRTIPDDAGLSWVAEGRFGGTSGQARDPWES